ncbi:MAG: amidohydrolase family protein [Acidobacteriaceae bacterium]|nr:amidohydrolase family protein [Acidobacteriaceae bacterium]MBV9764805.1 amidohydrolase family protein [Acidobacteriaceae bacterium]
MRPYLLTAAALSIFLPRLNGQSPITPQLQPFVTISDPVVALLHVRIIDGMGGPERADQTILLDHGTISSVGDFASTQVPANARRIELTGHTVYPGLVGMHEHLFYPAFYPPGSFPLYNEQAFSAPRLYLASGVTTMRTTGSLEPYTDINVRRLINEGKMPGPNIDVTGPYIEGPGGYSIQMPSIQSPDQARRLVEYWAQEGSTSFKAYMNISHDALAAAIKAAHERGIKITGHLCSVGFTEAAELGIDDLEHGLLVDTEFTPGKQRDICPDTRQSTASIQDLDLKGQAAQKMIHALVDHKVAVTSTLAVFDAMIPGRPPLEERMLDAMSPEAAESYLAAKNRAESNPNARNFSWLKKEMDFEREFVAAGGLLIAGCDPTGNGGALPGFGDQRNLELLVEAGFKPEEAIRIYTYNGATYLGRVDRIGSIAPGKQADLIVVEGDPSARIADVEKVKYVFKEGIAYDPAKLIESVRGAVGIH